jgi:formylglycine-generating enzyme required for sulfatase activity
VTLARPFAVGRFAVTFDEWDACAADGGCNGYKPEDKGWGRGRRPVIEVSWDDAKAYVAWLSKTTGKTYRQLSEAEREYVTRAGTTTPFWWGNSISTSQANYDGTSVNGEYRQQTLPVGSLQPNPWGLYHVHGNVWEWVEDCNHGSYSGAVRRLGLDIRRLQFACHSRRFLVQHTSASPLRLPRGARKRQTVQRHRLSGREDA